MSATIAVTGVTKSFGDLAALAPIDLDVAAGEIVTVLGPSGSGKTTLLRIVGGLDEPTAGTVTVDGASPHVARAAKRIGFVPQSPALLPWRTVGANARLLLDVNRRAPRPPAPTSPSCSPRSASTGSPTPTRTSCRAGCSSASPSCGRWRSARRCC